MTLRQCLFYDNGAYKAKKKITPIGIVVHSTGANNEMLRRYVQPSKTDKNYNALMSELGKNAYNNHLNQEYINGVYNDICMHGFIGLNANGKIETVQTLPYNYACWGCGSGAKGSYNYNPTAHIQFEICEDGLTDETYFKNAFTEAVEYCAYLCKLYNLTADKIVSHKEAATKGYASAHGDPENWLVKHGKNMDWFRDEVKKKLTQTETAKTNYIYRVQVGAYSDEKNAKAFLEKVKKAGFTNAFIKKEVK